MAALGLRGGGNPQNKFEYRADILSGYARDYRVVAEVDGVPKTRATKNGFLAGTYVQPVSVWVQGEQDVPGVPPPANDFSQLPWLTRGLGVDADGNLWGPLDPFPQSGLLIEPLACGTQGIEFEGDEVDTNWVPSCKWPYFLIFGLIYFYHSLPFAMIRGGLWGRRLLILILSTYSFYSVSARRRAASQLDRFQPHGPRELERRPGEEA